MALVEAMPVPIACIAIRTCPALPPTAEERIRDARAQTFADSVVYRHALATAAEALGWTVAWYDREEVVRAAERAVAPQELQAVLTAMGQRVGPPWQARHKLAATAALAACGAASRRR